MNFANDCLVDSQEHWKYCLHSNHVWITERKEFAEAFIFVNGQIIAEVLLPSTHQITIDYLRSHEYKTFTDYEELYIFPGLVDFNVSLHLGNEWEDVEDTTELLAEGGVTTLVCQPLLMKEEHLRDEPSSMRHKKERILNRSAIDYCFLANIYPDNLQHMAALRQEPGVQGFKIYLSQPVQDNTGWVESKKDMENVMKSINDLRIQIETEEASPDEKKKHHLKFGNPSRSLLLSFHSIKSGGKELTITSPLRQRKLQDRCDKTTQIRRTAGDSIQGETTKSQKENELHFNKYDQLEVVVMGDISSGINDNILNLKADPQSSSDEEGEENEENNPKNEIDQQGQNEITIQPPAIQEAKQQEDVIVSQQQQENKAESETENLQISSRKKFLKIFAQATHNQTENLQQKLIARAERKEYHCNGGQKEEKSSGSSKEDSSNNSSSSDTDSDSSSSSSSSNSGCRSDSNDAEKTEQTNIADNQEETNQENKIVRRKTGTKTGCIAAKREMRERYRSCLIQNQDLKNISLQAGEQNQQYQQCLSPNSLNSIHKSDSNSPQSETISKKEGKESEESADDQISLSQYQKTNLRNPEDQQINNNEIMKKQDEYNNNNQFNVQNSPQEPILNESKANDIDEMKKKTFSEENSTNCKFIIKVQKIDAEERTRVSSTGSKEEQLPSLPQIDENVESLKDSDSDSKEEEDEDDNDSILKLKSRRKAYSKNLSIPFDKRGSNDSPSINQHRGEPHIRLIKDMKRGSCDKDVSSYIAEHYVPNKKSFFNQPSHSVNEAVAEKDTEQAALLDNLVQDNNQTIQTEEIFAKEGFGALARDNQNDKPTEQKAEIQPNLEGIEGLEDKNHKIKKQTCQVEELLLKISSDRLDIHSNGVAAAQQVLVNTKLRQQGTMSPLKDQNLSPCSISSDTSFLTTSPNPQQRGVGRATRFSEKRKSMNLSVHIEGQRFNRSGEGLIQHKSTQGLEGNENESKDSLSIINLQSVGLICGEELGSLSQIEVQKKSYTSLDNPSIPQVQGSSPEDNSSKSFETLNKKQVNHAKTSETNGGHNNTDNLNGLQQNDDNIIPLTEQKTIEQIIEEETAAAAKELISKSSAYCNSPLVHLSSLKDGRHIAEMISQKQKEKSNFNTSNKSKFNQDYLTFLAFRPPYWEYFGISMIRGSIEKHAITSKVKLNILFQNIGNSNSMYRIMTLKEDLKCKERNVHLYSETVGAYLYFSSNKIRDGKTIFKSEPPIGSKENKEFLINASKLNMVDVVSSYHFPVEPRFKCIDEGDFRKAFSGLCTAGYTLQAAWTALYQSFKNTQLQQLPVHTHQPEEEKKRIEALLKYIVNMLSTKPAKILNIQHMKGNIQKGKYADFVIWDPFTPCHRIKVPSSYKFKKVHIFDKRRVYGQIHATILRGKVIYQGKSTHVQKGHGRLITSEGIK